MTPELWALLERTRPAGWAPDDHADRLTDALVADGVQATEAFDEAFSSALDALYRWDLWGVAYLAFGGLSDDGFEYLRCWLVVQGEEIWTQAQIDPEGLFIELLADAEDADERWIELGIHEAEPLLYAAGAAHQRLAGVPLPGRPSRADEPEGEAWDEDDLEARFPRLAGVLPDDWTVGGPEGPGGSDGVAMAVVGSAPPSLGALDGWMDALVAGLHAFSEGDHVVARDQLAVVVDDDAALDELAAVGFDVVDACYAAGMSRLILGDPDGAAAALRRAAADEELPGHVRRGLAQVELARGDLDAAVALLEDGTDVALLDRALQITVALRRGDAPDAHRRIADLAIVTVEEAGHQWDLAGAWAQAGVAQVELGDGEGAVATASSMDALIAGAPPELPLLGQARLVRAGGLRLLGRLDDAGDALGDLPATSTGWDRGAALLEAARQAAARGQDPSLVYADAARAFEAAGERWWAERATTEAASR